MCMARRCRMLPIPSFSDCSWAKCDVDKGRLEAIRNVLERTNLVLKSPRGWFRYVFGIMTMIIDFRLSFFKMSCIKFVFWLFL